MEELITENELVILDKGRPPTFNRGGSESIIDLTLATKGAAGREEEWKVSQEEENLSDHHNIYYRYN